jgi:alpha-D-ribose 1-methylphosphonate 5-triphosphate diphosphatase
MVGLTDRGQIAPGKRADFVRVRETATAAQAGAVPVPLATWREGRRIA